MKKTAIPTIVTILMFITFLYFNPQQVKAISNDVTSTVEYNEDGSYSVTSITILHNTLADNTISGNKSISHYSSNGVLQWTYTLNGSFSYNGSTSSCTSVSDSYTIYNNNWHINGRYHWKSGNTAYGSVTMDYKVLGITTDSVTRDLTLSCSANGTLS